MIRRVLASSSLDACTLVYGAGAGRLAVESMQPPPARTYALDVGPLPLLVADALLRGETVAFLPEMPVAPHELRAGGRRARACARRWARATVSRLLFADALRPRSRPPRSTWSDRLVHRRRDATCA